MSADDVTGLTDGELATELAAHNLEALAELYDRYGALAYSLAVRVLGDPGRAEDVVQEVFLKLWQRAGSFDAARGSLRTWLLVSVRNRAIDALRGREGRERQARPVPLEVVAVGAGSDPPQEVAAALERKIVRDALAALPGEQRRVVELAYFDGYTQREIADLERVPLSTVKGRTRLALEKLHSYLSTRGVIADG
jgi:RNA polymerase sigma-70 factor (ECF subfamily)